LRAIATLLATLATLSCGRAQTPAATVAPVQPAGPKQAVTCRPGDPLMLEDFAYCAAYAVVHSRNKPRDASEVTGFFDAMWVLALSKGVGSEAVNNRVNDRTMLLLQTEQETKRTDKQIGASASSRGSTTLAEKAGFADLLGLAIENGAVQKEVSGSTLTLSTTPYALTTIGGGDTAAHYHKFGELTRLGLSATFNISDQQNVLANATRRQLAEWSAKFRLTADASARSRAAEKYWQTSVVSKVSAPAAAISQTAAAASGLDVSGRRDQIERKFFDAQIDASTNQVRIKGYVQDFLNAHAASGDDELVLALRDDLLAHLKEDITDQINSLGLDQKAKAKLAALVPSLKDAQVSALGAVKDFQDFLKSLSSKPVASVAYSNVRDTTSSTYSVFKFLLEKTESDVMQLDFNASASLYSNPNPALNQQRVRDYAAALDWSGKLGRSPFATMEGNESQVTFSFSGRYQRLLENRHVPGKKADLASAQAKLEIPLFAGATIPLSITYSNANEISTKDRVRFNFGLNFDTDKLYQLLRLSK